ncbi:hypothetical protein PInf_013725 [Phytophthora infestans]|nr:hypothetical protein PInf_013725 [Phytophthora infestans]
MDTGFANDKEKAKDRQDNLAGDRSDSNRSWGNPASRPPRPYDRRGQTNCRVGSHDSFNVDLVQPAEAGDIQLTSVGDAANSASKTLKSVRRPEGRSGDGNRMCEIDGIEHDLEMIMKAQLEVQALIEERGELWCELSETVKDENVTLSRMETLSFGMLLELLVNKLSNDK